MYGGRLSEFREKREREALIMIIFKVIQKIVLKINLEGHVQFTLESEICD